MMLTEAQFMVKFEDLSKELYKNWSKGEKLILVIANLKELCEDYIRTYLRREEAKLQNGAD